MTTPSKKYINLVKKYGPGFVALSKTSGRVLAHGKDIEKLYQNADIKRVDFSKIIITHVPKYGTISLYLRLNDKSGSFRPSSIMAL